ncbi:hypothetical protein LCL95_01700 [Bacillus timonensis]|nr:hypothetical protein [Bacillus timonensis]
MKKRERKIKTALQQTFTEIYDNIDTLSLYANSTNRSMKSDEEVKMLKLQLVENIKAIEYMTSSKPTI